VFEHSGGRANARASRPSKALGAAARAGLELIIDLWWADMADLPGGASGMLCRDYKGKGSIGWWSAATPAWSRWSRNSAGHERQATEELGQWKTRVEEHKPLDASQAASGDGQPGSRAEVFPVPGGGRVGPFPERRSRSGQKMRGKGSHRGGWMYNRCWPGWQNGNSG